MLEVDKEEPGPDPINNMYGMALHTVDAKMFVLSASKLHYSCTSVCTGLTALIQVQIGRYKILYKGFSRLSLRIPLLNLAFNWELGHPILVP